MTVTTFNGRGILDVRRVERQTKLTFMTEVALNSDIVFLQELHGTEEEFETAAPHILLSHRMFVNPGTGGTAILVRRTWLGEQSGVDPQNVVTGRVQRLVINRGGRRCVLWCVHNFGMSGAEVDEIVLSMHADMNEALLDPTRTAVFIAGDWNFIGPLDFHGR